MFPADGFGQSAPLPGFFGSHSRKRSAPQTPRLAIQSPSKGLPIQEPLSPRNVSPPAKRSKHNAMEEAMPLAERMRPKSLEDLAGHEELVGENGVLRELILTDRVPSMIFWAGPGVPAPKKFDADR